MQHTSRHLRRCGRCGVAASLWATWLLVSVQAGPAGAQLLEFTVDPNASSISFDSGSASLDVGLPGGPLTIDLLPQPGAGTARLFGSLFINVDTGFPRITFFSPQSFVVPGIESPPALPGLPQDPGTPMPAQLAGEGSESLFGIEVVAAMRESGFLIANQNIPMVLQQPGRFSLNASGGLRIQVGGGAGDVAAPGLPLSSRLFLTEGTRTDQLMAAGGTLEMLAPGRWRLALPFQFDLALGTGDFPAPLDMDADVTLRGEIVAYHPVVPAPEPGALLLAVVALTALAGLARARRAGVAS